MKTFNQYLTIVQENREEINEGVMSNFGAIIALLTGLTLSPMKANEIKDIENKVNQLSNDAILNEKEKAEYEEVINKIIDELPLQDNEKKELKTPIMGKNKYSYYKEQIKEILSKYLSKKVVSK